MSKFIIILSVAVFASVTHAASVKKSGILKEIKDECIFGITETFEKVIDALSDIASFTDETEASNAVDHAIVRIEKLIEQVQAAETIEPTPEPINIHPEVPVKCSKEVSDELVRLVYRAMEVAEIGKIDK